MHTHAHTPQQHRQHQRCAGRPTTSQVHTCGAGKQRQRWDERESVKWHAHNACKHAGASDMYAFIVTTHKGTRHTARHICTHGSKHKTGLSCCCTQDTQAACTAAACMQACLRVTRSSCSVLYTKGPTLCCCPHSFSGPLQQFCAQNETNLNNQPLHKHKPSRGVVSQSTQGPTLQGEDSTKVQLWRKCCVS